MAGSGSSKPSRSFDLAFVLPLLAALSATSAAWFLSRGYALYYGDAQAHLSIARRVFDSRTPGYYQIGTVWLPLPHVLMLPFVGNDEWWRSGLAGVVPSAACFVIAGCFFYAAVRRALAGRAAAITALAVLALNPNLLYLQSTPMTEPVFLACLAALLYFTVRFEQMQSAWCVAGAAMAALAATLTRYEGWFLLPFAVLFFLLRARRRRWLLALMFCTIAALGPLYWLFHNWFWWGDALEFYRGPFSARAIYERSLAEGMARYPGDHDWSMAWLHFRNAARLCAGWPLVWLGLAGVAAAAARRAVWPIVLLALPAVFYVVSLHSGGTPIYVPHLWPNTYYNTRYGLAALPWLALGGGALAALAPRRFRALSAVAIVVGALAPWAVSPRPESWICWKESQVNSEARRAWTKEAADFLRLNYRRGAGIFLSFGDLAGILQQAGIPLRESLHTGNVPHWEAAVGRPDLFLWEEWAIAISGDKVSDAMVRLRKTGPRYDCVRTIARKGAPVIEIYRRGSVAGRTVSDFPAPRGEKKGSDAFFAVATRLIPHAPERKMRLTPFSPEAARNWGLRSLSPNFMRIPFTKAHGAKNDFLLTWANEAPLDNLPDVARGICSRNTGVGGDGWMLVAAPPKGADYHGEIRLYNSDGSKAELSGNGTRCAAAFLIDAGLDAGIVRLRTAAGDRELRLIEHRGLRFLFEMTMGRPSWDAAQVRFPLEVAGQTREVTIVNAGNPQCAVFVDDFDFDWRKLGAAIESHPLFPDRTNVSFVRVVDRHTLDVRFYERGAGETMSSGTGSTGAAWAAALRGMADSPVRVLTPGGPLDLRWDDQVHLTGPAEIVAGGVFYFGD